MIRSSWKMVRNSRVLFRWKDSATVWWKMGRSSAFQARGSCDCSLWLENTEIEHIGIFFFFLSKPVTGKNNGLSRFIWNYLFWIKWQTSEVTTMSRNVFNLTQAETPHAGAVGNILHTDNHDSCPVLISSASWQKHSVIVLTRPVCLHPGSRG